MAVVLPLDDRAHHPPRWGQRGAENEVATGELHLLAADAEELRSGASWGDERAQGVDEFSAVEFA